MEGRTIVAALLGCKPGELLGYGVRDDGTVVAVAPNGQKFTYAPWELAEAVHNQISQRPTALQGGQRPDVSQAGQRPAQTATAKSADAAPPKKSKPVGAQHVVPKKK